MFLPNSPGQKFRLTIRISTIIIALGLLVVGSGFVPLAQETPTDQATSISENSVPETPLQTTPETTPALETPVSPPASEVPALTSSPEALSSEVSSPEAPSPEALSPEVLSPEAELPLLEPAGSPNPAAPVSPAEQSSPIILSLPSDDTAQPLKIELPSQVGGDVGDAVKRIGQIGETETTAEPSKPPVPWYENGYIVFSIYILIFIVCGYFSNAFAKAWRMPDHAIKMFIVSFCLFGAIATTFLSWHKLTLGIDLRGGVVLVYDVKKPVIEQEEAGQIVEKRSTDEIDFDQLKRAIDRRINPAGVKEISVQKYGTNQLKIIIPDVDAPEVDRIQKIISDAGTLEFRILASERFDASLIARAKVEKGTQIFGPEGNLQAKWIPLNEHEASTYINNRDLATRPTAKGYEILVLIDQYNVSGKYLANVREEYAPDEETGLPQKGVAFQLKGRGVQLFADLTRRYAPDDANKANARQLGIILSGELYSAPRLNNAIPTGRCQITFGQRSGDKGGVQLERDIKDLIQVMEAGSLPADLEGPISRMLTGSTLGEDTINRGKVSAAVAIFAVLLFMVVYYRFCGVIACAAVLLNFFMIMSVMLTIRAAFTLSGLAGLVLTLGMAIDANILIYERLREELNGGATLKMAIRNAFSRASTAIIDSNVTTLIIAMIMYVVGTEQTKGFAVTLFLGVTFSMFAAVYCARVVFDVAENRRWITKLRMMRLLENPRIDFMSYRKASMTFIIVLCVLSFVAVIARGKSIFDIDFVGGVNVEVVFKERQDENFIRSQLDEYNHRQDDPTKKLVDNTVSAVSADIAGNKDRQDDISVLPGTRFSINTATPVGMQAEDYLQTVIDALTETFGESLYYNTVQFESTESIKANDEKKTTAEITVEPSINYRTLESEISGHMKRLFELPAGDENKIERIMAFAIHNEAGTAKELAETSQPYKNWTVVFDGPKSDVDKVLREYQMVIKLKPWFPSSNTIGSVVAIYARISALAAIITSFVAIVIYLWFRFHKVVFGYAAVIALVTNVIVTLGAIAASYWFAPFLGFLMVDQFKISLTVIAAFLTVIGYSVNDTIILFDRIREVRGKSPLMTIDMINLSTNQTLSRTLLTALSTLFVVLVLYFFGGAGLHAFAFTLAIGIIVGTFSSIFIAAPLLYWMIGKPGNVEKQ